MGNGTWNSGQVLMWAKQAFRLMSAVVLCCICSGCGGSSENGDGEPVTGAAAEAGQEQKAATAESVQAEAATRDRNEVWTDANGQKWFGKVPLDAFFDTPYEVATNGTSIGGPAGNAEESTGAMAAGDGNPPEETVAVAMADSSEPPAADPAVASAGGSQTWGELISAQVLDDEVKSVRNFLQENVTSVGTYNSSMLMIPPRAATLAALAELARQEPGDVSWAEDAGYVRDLAGKMNEAPLQRGAKDQRRLMELYEAVSDILNRSTPAGLDDPAEGVSFSDVAEMQLLMKRIESAEQLMRTEIGSEDAIREKAQFLVHEASVLGTLTRIISMEGYGYEDDEEFRGYAGQIVNATTQLKDAAATQNFGGFEEAMSAISTACQACHSVYKNN